MSYGSITEPNPHELVMLADPILETHDVPLLTIVDDPEGESSVLYLHHIRDEKPTTSLIKSGSRDNVVEKALELCGVHWASAKSSDIFIEMTTTTGTRTRKSWEARKTLEDVVSASQQSLERLAEAARLEKEAEALKARAAELRGES